MSRRSLVAPAGVVLAALLTADAARADEPPLQGDPASSTSPSTIAPVPAPVIAPAALDASWRLVRIIPAHGLRVFRYEQWIDGVRVDGAAAVVRTRADGAIDLVRADTFARGAFHPPRVDWSAARAQVTTAARASDVGFVIVRAHEPEPTWARPFFDEAAPLEPAMRVRVEGASLAERASVLVALDGPRVLRIDDLVTHAMGRIYARNPRSDAGVTTDVELPPTLDAATLTSEGFSARSCIVGGGGSCTPVARAVPDVDGNFLLDPMPTSFEDGFAEVMAFHHASLLAARLERDHGYRWTCHLGEPMRLFPNFTDSPGRAYANAAYVQGNRDECGYLLFGQSGAIDFAYDADVVYHELGHSVTDQLAQIVGFAGDSLGMHYEPLGVNEGTSDYWAATTQGDPHVGESLEGIDGVGRSAALRDLDGGLRCPEALVGEGHFDGRIWAGALWDLRTELGAEKMDALVFTTIASLGTAPTLSDAAEMAASTADSLASTGTLTASDAARVRAVLGDRGLLACRRIVPLDDGANRAGYSGIPFLTGGLGHDIAPVHYSLTLPADATSMSFEVIGRTLAGNYAVLAKRDRPVATLGARVILDQRDLVGRMGRVTYDAASPAFAPCTTVYFAIETTDLDVDQSLYTVSASVARSGDPAARCPDPEPDAGPPTDAFDSPDAFESPDAGPPAPPPGCGCRTSAPREHGPFWTVISTLALLGVRRRAGRLTAKQAHSSASTESELA